MKIQKRLALTIFCVSAAIFAVSPAKAAYDAEKADPVRLNDVIMTLLMPEIQDAVKTFYKPYLTIEPTVVPYYGTEIVGLKGGEHIREGISNSHYIITVEVSPYVGPHLAVGRDRITLEVMPWRETAVVRFEHLKSCELPWNYQSAIKKPLP